eukprot:Phypoly_transcript_12512.p1 GENE.Phypoly_transcript_12512~~Phypoly_transcript_12512.p1  ORF type:complete len:325 (+),score=19.36 Phypoly_transcript_12512:114-1088(+)
MNNETAPGCSCDPYSPTNNCCVSCCTPFFGVFLFLQACILTVLVSFYTVVELRAQKKSVLWRLIFSSAIISCAAKVLRLGMLANPATRHKSNELLLLFLNTHQCFGIIGFLSLVFFWARLHHDITRMPKKGSSIYGKLLPIYIVIAVLTLVLYYGQLPVDKVFHGTGALLDSFKLLSSCVAIISAVAYIVYAVLLWTTVNKKRDTNPLFYRIYISAFVTAIFLIIVCLVVFVTRIYDSDSVRSYFIRHSIYEICYFAQLAALPSGFIVHFIKTKSYRRSRVIHTSMTHPMAGIVNETQGTQGTQDDTMPIGAEPPAINLTTFKE